MDDPIEIVRRFNAAINTQNISDLVGLMAEDHTFVDSSGQSETGKAAMKASWRKFFRAYPDYQNVFEHVEAQGNSVVVRGYSTCSNEPALEGPAIWMATVEDGLVSEWRVLADTPANRRKVGLS